MIRAEELKKGNLFLCQLEVDKGEEVCKVEWVTKNGIENQTGGICPYSSSRPIPLNPEWLERFGFKKTVEWPADHWDEDNEGNVRIIETVHQLQNLYFALTGEELNVKL